MSVILPTLLSEDRIASLREEHRAIVRQLGGIRRALGQKKQRPQRKRELINALGAQLRVHFAHEEAAIYGPLNSVLKERSPTKELMEDHQAITQAFERIRGMGTGQGEASVPDLRDQVQHLQSALRKHLDKEEKVIFWLADYHL